MHRRRRLHRPTTASLASSCGCNCAHCSRCAQDSQPSLIASSRTRAVCALLRWCVYLFAWPAHMLYYYVRRGCVKRISLATQTHTHSRSINNNPPDVCAHVALRFGSGSGVCVRTIPPRTRVACVAGRKRVRCARVHHPTIVYRTETVAIH